MKESKTPGTKKKRRATVPGGSEQSWRWVTVPSVACTFSEVLAQQPSRGDGAGTVGDAPAPRWCGGCTGARPQQTVQEGGASDRLEISSPRRQMLGDKRVKKARLTTGIDLTGDNADLFETLKHRLSGTSLADRGQPPSPFFSGLPGPSPCWGTHAHRAVSSG